MDIGIEASAACHSEPSGIPRYAAGLAQALATNFPDDHLTFLVKPSRWRKRRYLYNPAGLAVRICQGAWLPPPWSRPALVHGTNGWLPPWRGAARVVTVHDLAVFRFRDAWFAPEHFRKRRQQAYLRLRKEADLVIAPSRATRDDLIELFGFGAERIRVVHHGIDDHFRQDQPPEAAAALLAQHGLAPGFVLFVGRVSTRKNVSAMVEAFARSGAARDRELVLAGPAALGIEEIRARIAALGVDLRVRMLGFLPDESAVQALYRSAGALLFATHYEGFGLPILEAMACGLPVVAGSLGAAPEIAGGHAQLADPGDPQAIAAALDLALQLPAAQRAAAAAYAREFSWQKAARETRAVYQEALQLRR